MNIGPALHTARHSLYAKPLLICSVVLLAVAPAAATPWSKVRAPSSGPISVIGGPSNGCVDGAKALPETGPGYVSIRRHRNRFYGHPDLLDMVGDLGRKMSRSTDKHIMIGDLSQPRGGLMSSSHRSHQNGLDADVWLTFAASPQAARRDTPEKRDPESMVARDGNSTNGRWNTLQRMLLKEAARDKRVDRIFVNPAIKQTLCTFETTDRGWLRKLRPWWGHDAHFHVRLKCPKDSPQCKQQAPLPAGDGCDKSLAWWFSDEARNPKKRKSKPKPTPVAPAACRALLTGS